MKKEQLEDYIVSIPDFPEPGIIFRDITSMIQDPDGLKDAVNGLCKSLDGLDFDLVLGLEARGFIFGAAVAAELGKGFVPVRKKGKLPRETITESYDLEYGTAEIELHCDSIKKGQKVVIIDDLIATGGTLEAAAKLVERLGGEIVKISVIMELAGLEGRKKTAAYPTEALITYPGK